MRYLPLTDDDRRAMLAKIGVASVDALFGDVPDKARLKAPVDLPPFKSELEVERHISALAAKNLGPGSCPSFLGAGAYRHHIPASVDHLIQRGEFLTSYTPYQPEVTQGTLQYLFEFQTQVALLTGMDVANASMYDGATATCEAVAMANRVTRRSRAVLSGGLHPHYREVIETHGKFTGFEVAAAPTDSKGAEDLTKLIDAKTSCVVVQNPSFFGHVHDLSALAKACHDAGALLVVAVTEVVSLGLVTPPGEMGADIVTAEGQSLGVPLSFGGPYVGLFATRDKFIRQMPGRLTGQTIDVDGKRGWVLTLSTREQHIRREKATSNICTNEALNALAAGIYMAALGRTGVRRVAEVNARRAHYAKQRLCALPGVRAAFDAPTFNEFALRMPLEPDALNARLVEYGILGGLALRQWYPELPDGWLVCVTEARSRAQIDAMVEAVARVVGS